MNYCTKKRKNCTSYFHHRTCVLFIAVYRYLNTSEHLSNVANHTNGASPKAVRLGLLSSHIQHFISHESTTKVLDVNKKTQFLHIFSDTVFLWHEQRIHIFKSIKFTLVNLADDFPERKRTIYFISLKHLLTFLLFLLELQYIFRSMYFSHLLIIRSQLYRFIGKLWVEVFEIPIWSNKGFVWRGDLLLVQHVPVNGTEERVRLNVSKPSLWVAT